MPWHEQPADIVWPPPGPVPRRMPDGAILVRRVTLTPDGPVLAGYETVRPGEKGFTAWSSFIDSRPSLDEGQ
jgi:hypothetical protein